MNRGVVLLQQRAKGIADLAQVVPFMPRKGASDSALPRID
jgi:hypothetical protein